MKGLNAAEPSAYASSQDLPVARHRHSINFWMPQSAAVALRAVDVETAELGLQHVHVSVVRAEFTAKPDEHDDRNAQKKHR
eukprot:CAMPEP_0181407676 /NCGR_PEP_ID=MMETSP1110-20121109/5901_1 /TAXON_ID=174948 /ORGANISM="Symbiodinium sp., Strain CCMP421" /LENGTH=80 /DNA_ID=CAMNT_0023530109 /DNA_START=517 /DNA_END=759 /DNA_ORIENTATION=-